VHGVCRDAFVNSAAQIAVNLKKTAPTGQSPGGGWLVRAVRLLLPHSAYEFDKQQGDSARTVPQRPITAAKLLVEVGTCGVSRSSWGRNGMHPSIALILLPRQPEPRDLAVLLCASVPSRTFVHPDPVLSAEESDEYAAYQATFMTPTSVWSKKLTGLQLGISVSLGDPKEERALGLSSLLHLEDATRIVARQALAAGATLVYGGALRGN
jgi:hypothetical protein